MSAWQMTGESSCAHLADQAEAIQTRTAAMRQETPLASRRHTQQKSATLAFFAPFVILALLRLAVLTPIYSTGQASQAQLLSDTQRER